MEVPCYYHIGIAKTGTTTIQAVFGKDERVRQIRSGRLLLHADWWLEPYGISDSDDRVLIESDETLSQHRAGRSHLAFVLDRIRSVEPDAHIIVSIREQKGLLLSSYKHAVLHRYAGSLGDFYFRHAPGLAVINSMAYSVVDSTIRAFFPRERIHYFLLEEMREDPTTFFHELYAVFGLTPPDSLEQTWNPALDDDVLFMLRKLNRVRPKATKPGSRKRVRSVFCSAATWTRRLAPSDPSAEWTDELDRIFGLLEADVHRWNSEFAAGGAIDADRLRRHGYAL